MLDRTDEYSSCRFEFMRHSFSRSLGQFYAFFRIRAMWFSTGNSLLFAGFTPLSYRYYELVYSILFLDLLLLTILSEFLLLSLILELLPVSMTFVALCSESAF